MLRLNTQVGLAACSAGAVIRRQLSRAAKDCGTLSGALTRVRSLQGSVFHILHNIHRIYSTVRRAAARLLAALRLRPCGEPSAATC
jgi:5-bromo-4-chloroindolyl phosphate hydrolysis protein